MSKDEHGERVDLKVRTKQFALRVIKLFGACRNGWRWRSSAGNFSNQGLRLGRIFVRLTGPGRMLNSWPSSVIASKNWKKLPTGLNCWSREKSSQRIDFQRSTTSVTNSSPS